MNHSDQKWVRVTRSRRKTIRRPLLTGVGSGFAAVIGLILAGCGAGQKMDLHRVPDLAYILEAQETYTNNASIPIEFTLRNQYNEPVWILIWNTPLEGIKNRIFVVTCNGKDLPYHGMMVKRGDPDRSSYVLLDPESAVKTKVNLATTYRFPPQAECQVSLKNETLADYVYEKENLTLGRTLDDLINLSIRGNAVSFRVLSE